MKQFNNNIVFTTSFPRIHVSSYPFNYVVIEDVFDVASVFALTSAFQELIQFGKPIGKVGEVGSLIYDAINFTPKLEHVQSTAVSLLTDLPLQNSIAELFGIQLDENLMLGMHRHLPPSKPGWTHTDFAIVSFPNTPTNFRNQRIYDDKSGCVYSDDSRDRQPDAIKTARSVACLYYIANPNWREGMGGETGIYLPDGKTLVAKIPPKNNLLFAFEVSPLSYHAYLGSETMQRNSFIWWYHSHPSYLIHRYEAMAQAKAAGGMDPWDRWTDTSVPKHEFPILSQAPK